MKLNQLKQPFKSKHSRKRIGRGGGSGHGGHTSTRGHKGHKSRAGYSLGYNFEGGQMPLIRRVPKKGFTHLSKIKWQQVNLDRLETVFSPGDIVDKTKLKQFMLAKDEGPVKILGNGKISKNLEVHANSFSRKAREKIETAGGKAVLIAM